MLLKLTGLSLIAALLAPTAALACSMTPMGASTLQIEGVLKHVGKQYEGKFTSAISNIKTVSFNRFVVTIVDTKTGKTVNEHKYVVGIGADCSTTVKETGP